MDLAALWACMIIAVTLPISTVKTANVKDFVDTRFIEKLAKSGYIDGLYK